MRTAAVVPGASAAWLTTQFAPFIGPWGRVASTPRAADEGLPLPRLHEARQPALPPLGRMATPRLFSTCSTVALTTSSSLATNLLLHPRAYSSPTRFGDAIADSDQTGSRATSGRCRFRSSGASLRLVPPLGSHRHPGPLQDVEHRRPTRPQLGCDHACALAFAVVLDDHASVSVSHPAP